MSYINSSSLLKNEKSKIKRKKSRSDRWRRRL